MDLDVEMLLGEMSFPQREGRICSPLSSINRKKYNESSKSNIFNKETDLDAVDREDDVRSNFQPL